MNYIHILAQIIKSAVSSVRERYLDYVLRAKIDTFIDLNTDYTMRDVDTTIACSTIVFGRHPVRITGKGTGYTVLVTLFSSVSAYERRKRRFK
jgi:hypothetical protein